VLPPNQLQRRFQLSKESLNNIQAVIDRNIIKGTLQLVSEIAFELLWSSTELRDTTTSNKNNSGILHDAPKQIMAWN